MTENKLDFRSSMDRLEDIVAKLERNEIALEEAMTLFEEGLSLVNQCDQQLTQFENKVQALLTTYQKEKQDEE